MTVIARQLRKRFDQELEVVGVTRSQWTAIAVVAVRPGAAQRTLADALDMSEAAAGRLIDRLCTDGMMERRPREDDRRAYSVFLTDQARPILDRLGAVATRLEGQIFRDVDEEDLTRLRATLGTLYTNMNG